MVVDYLQRLDRFHLMVTLHSGEPIAKLATAEWVEWLSRRRLHTAAGDLPPAEYEEVYCRGHGAPEAA